ncbi:Glycerol kinase [Serratia fonticola]|uniref:Glycerol kinase n=1 Tax=Serratia fonticola TaxID=47917 RepID=A0A4U9U9G7_SERFO|nr:Glycerol kinase [Serratia fonticola]
MSSPIILAIDEGTTNAKVVAVDRHGQIVARCSVGCGDEPSTPGPAEQDPLAIWQAVCQALGGCLRQLGTVTVAGIAISNQRESVLVWQRLDGKPLTPVVSWQDRRSETYCRTLCSQGYSELSHSAYRFACRPSVPGRQDPSLVSGDPRRYAAG